jgi:hypothetical protein
MPTSDLEQRARRAYELGRIRNALPVLALIVPATALSLSCCPLPGASLVCGGLLSALCVGLLWYGRAPGRAVWPGLATGLLPFLTPLALHATGHACAPGDCALMPAACVSAGLLAGALLGFVLTRFPENRRPSLFAAAVVAALAGSLGCVLMGASGVAGMSAGLVAGAAPVLLVLRRAPR